MLHCAPILAAPPDGGIGINLTSVYPGAPTLPFADVFKQSGEWRSLGEGLRGGANDRRLELTAEGWVRSLTSGQQAVKTILEGGRYPAGVYRLSYDGQGELLLQDDAKIVGRLGKDWMVRVVPRDRITLRIAKTNEADPIRNVRIFLPGHDPATSPFASNPKYLDYLRGFQVLRFVGWANINEEDVVEWSERTQTRNASQYGKAGVALEHMIQIAAEANASPWFNVPTRANDAYVRQMAVLIKEKMKPGRKFYVEYSNELWNSAFPQYQYAIGEAKRLGLKDADDFYVRRSLQVFRIFEGVFGGPSRFVRVLSGQAVNAWRAEKLLHHRDIGTVVDAYAVAPYFGYQDQLLGKGGSASELRTTSRDVLMQRLDRALAETRAVIRMNADLARRAGLPLIAYEAGQHVTNPPGDDAFCATINRDPRMADLYRKYIEIWVKEASGNLMMLAGDIFAYGRYGCWGLTEFLGQNLQAAPKLSAVRQYMKQTGVKP